MVTHNVLAFFLSENVKWIKESCKLGETFLLRFFAFRQNSDEIWIEVLVLDASIFQNNSLWMDVLCEQENDKLAF